MSQQKSQIIKILCTDEEREAIQNYITTRRRTEILLAEVRRVTGWHTQALTNEGKQSDNISPETTG